MLLYPMLLYVGACILVPADASKDTDWRAHYYSARSAFFGLTIVEQVTAGVTVVSLLDVPILSPPTYLLSAFAALYSIGLFTDRPRVHAAIALINALFIVILYAPLVYSPFVAPM